MYTPPDIPGAAAVPPSGTPDGPSLLGLGRRAPRPPPSEVPDNLGLPTTPLVSKGNGGSVSSPVASGSSSAFLPSAPSLTGADLPSGGAPPSRLYQWRAPSDNDREVEGIGADEAKKWIGSCDLRFMALLLLCALVTVGVAWSIFAYVDGRGPTGIQGDKGDKGDKGDQGEQGPIGPQGETGETGHHCRHRHMPLNDPAAARRIEREQRQAEQQAEIDVECPADGDECHVVHGFT